MALSWSGRRQALYTAVGLVAVFFVLFVVYETFFTAPPTCFDNKMDGNEAGLDCGGSCSLLCPDTAKAPVVEWARAFPTGGGYYTAAAYVVNNNSGAAARSVHYSFQLFDDKNLLVVQRDGVTDLPPVQNIPIVEPNINAGTRTVTHALFAFSSSPAMVWNKVPSGAVPLLTTTQQNLAPDASTLSATLTNDTLIDAHVTVTAVLYDASGVARGASKSALDVPRKSSAPVIFTWPGGVPNIVRAEITVLPSF